MAAVAAQLTNAFNLLPETECCGLYAAKALINHSREPRSRTRPMAGPVPPKRLMRLIGRGWPEPGAA